MSHHRCRTFRFRHRPSGTLCAAALALLWACAPKVAPPSADAAPTAPPPLAGRAVFVLPAQPAPGAAVAGGEAVPGLDADIGYFLAERAPGVRWVLQPAVERAAANAPTLRIRPRELAVAAFHRMKVERIGDPLFGELHTLGVLLEARLALLPYAAAWVPEPGGALGRVELGVALIDTSDGDVLWAGVVAGERAAPGSPGATASAASALARLLAR